MLNKIDYFKGFGDYREGVSRWSAETESYLFGVKETGVTNEEGQQEKEYYRYEYSRLLSPDVVEKEFVNAYMERAGYDLATQLKVSASSDGAVKLEMERVMADAYFHAAGINHPGDRLEQAKRIKCNEIERYDQSEAVNQYYINDIPDWLHLEHRTSLRGSLVDMQADGQELFELWHAGMMVSLPVAQAREMLKQLETYARACLSNTNKHLAAVDKLTTVEEVNNYDYKVGYPEKIRINF